MKNLRTRPTKKLLLKITTLVNPVVRSKTKGQIHLHNTEQSSRIRSWLLKLTSTSCLYCFSCPTCGKLTLVGSGCVGSSPRQWVCVRERGWGGGVGGVEEERQRGREREWKRVSSIKALLSAAAAKLPRPQLAAIQLSGCAKRKRGGEISHQPYGPQFCQRHSTLRGQMANSYI